MYFSTSINKHCGLPVIYLGNCECQFVNEVKYLGVMIHSSMKTTIDVTRQTKKFYMQANLLLRNFRHCSDDVTCSLFQKYCTNTVQVTCLFPGDFHHLQNFCVNLFIDLQNELKLAQILSLQPVYLHCYIFHPLYVNGGVLYFM